MKWNFTQPTNPIQSRVTARYFTQLITGWVTFQKWLTFDICVSLCPSKIITSAQDTTRIVVEKQNKKTKKQKKNTLKFVFKKKEINDRKKKEQTNKSVWFCVSFFWPLHVPANVYTNARINDFHTAYPLNLLVILNKEFYHLNFNCHF